MKLVTDYEPLLGGIGHAAVAAGRDTHSDVQARISRRTGRLAAGTVLVVRSLRSTRIRMAITSSVVYADAVERGAWGAGKRSVKAGTKRRRSKGQTVSGPVFNRSGRGPHMKGSHVIRDTAPRFLGHMSDRLRSRL